MDDTELVKAIRQAVTATDAELAKLWEKPDANVNVDNEDIMCRFYDRIKELLTG